MVEIPSRADPRIRLGAARRARVSASTTPLARRVADGVPGGVAGPPGPRLLRRMGRAPGKTPERPPDRPTQCPTGCPPIGGHPAGHSVGHCVGRRAPGLLGRPGQRPPLSPPVARGSSCRPVSPRVPRVALCRPVSPVSRTFAPVRACRPAGNSVHISVHLQVDRNTDRVAGGLWTSTGQAVEKRGFRERRKSRFPACRPPKNMTVGFSHVYISPNFKSPPRGRSWGGLVTLYITRTGCFCEIFKGVKTRPNCSQKWVI